MPVNSVCHHWEARRSETEPGGTVKYKESKAIGDIGERVVADILSAYEGSDSRIVNDVLLDAVDDTTQIDHLYIDRFGILLVETKHHGAIIRGKSDEDRWTACYSNGTKKFHQNPIKQDARHREKLTRVLQQHDMQVPAKYLQSQIVYTKGDITHLELTAADRARVVTADEFRHVMETRSDFIPNEGDRDSTWIRTVADLLEGLNRVDDASVQAKHGENVKRAAGLGRRRFRAPRFGRANRGPRRLPAPVGVRVQPPQSSHAGAGRSESSPLRAIFVVLAVLMLSLCSCNILASIGRQLAARPSVPPPGATTEPAAAVVPHDIPAALAVLQTTDPAVYGALVNKDAPTLSVTRGYPTYTWEYAEKTDANAVRIRKYTVVLDSGGRLIGVSRE